MISRFWRAVQHAAQKAGYLLLDLSDWAEDKARRARR
jgi:hypothetical protein